jgi:hypothetical protein
MLFQDTPAHSELFSLCDHLGSGDCGMNGSSGNRLERPDRPAGDLLCAIASASWRK